MSMNIDDLHLPASDVSDNQPVPVLSFVLCFVLPIPVLLFWLFELIVQERRQIVEVIDDDSDDEDDKLKNSEGLLLSTDEVLFASLEHAVPGLKKARVVAGGLGKVVDLISRHHPGNIIMVHPKVKEQTDKAGNPIVSYEPLQGEMEKKPSLRITVDGIEEEVEVFSYTAYPAGDCGFRATFLLLSHEMFEMRTKDTIYPNPMTRRGVLRFFSLWNQAVGQLIVRYKPAVYHCPDFHCAVAPWYAIKKHPKLKMVLTLHNAEYQGTISTDMIRGPLRTTMANIWNLPENDVQRRLIFHGRFNMLKAAVDFIHERQDGKGVCAVSHEYAKECHTAYSLFWGLRYITGMPNPMLEEDRPALREGLTFEETRDACKAEIQNLCALEVDPEARLFVFMGRMVRQKGVDLLADIAPWLLDKYPKAQLVIVGPVADGFGCYAREKLEAISRDEQYSGRVFIKCEFWRAPPALKLAADFCLMPSRDEPFGYVDIEFAWCGAALVGAKAGGLGKVPGFYYQAQNRDNLERLRLELKTAVDEAMRATKERLQEMAHTANGCNFPLKRWQHRTLAFYGSVLPNPAAEGQSWVTMQSMPSDASKDRADSDQFSGRGRKMANVLSSETSLKPNHRHSLVAAIAEGQHSFDVGDSGQEFLLQELSEEELAEKVRNKIAATDDWSIEQILKAVGADLNRSREKDKVARWLLKEVRGEPRVHWLVCAGYVASFASSMLTNVVAVYWGFRSSPFGQDSLFVIPYGEDSEVIVPSSWMPMIIVSVDSFAFMIGAPLWGILAQFVEPRRLLALNLLSKPLLLLVIAPLKPNALLALLMIAVESLINSAALLFVCYNFMMTIEADLSKVAIRMGILEMLRYAMTWTLSAYLFVADPLVDSHDNSWRATFLFLPIGICIMLLTVIPGILILAAPGPYRDDRFPGWDLRLFWKRKSFVFLTLSECIGDCGKFASGMFLTWCMTNKWSPHELGMFCLIFVLFFTFATGVWTFLLSKASKHGFSFLMGVVLLLAPPTILRAIVLEEVSTGYSSPPSGSYHYVLPICAYSLLMEGIRESSVWCAKIRILNSRWRLLSYGTVTFCFSHFLCGIAPWACEWLLAQPYGASFITTSPKQLSDAVVICLVPIGVFQFISQVCALPWIHKDMGIAGGAENARNDKRKNKGVCGGVCWQHRFLIGYPAWITIAGVLIYCFFFLYKQVYKPMDYHPVANCHVEHVEQLSENCKVLFETETDKHKEKFGRNSYGFFTSARMKCLDLMDKNGGDTYVFDVNYCKVLQCGEAPAPSRKGYMKVVDSYNIPRAEVWSQHCTMSYQNFVLVQLFEWPWNDVAEECENYLGPAGFDAVGVSPPVEHITGDTWFLRYQPVSFDFSSRGGDDDEFQDMVTRCARVGVKVMVDVVLNHMAATWIINPYRYTGHECGKEDTPPCIGWNGTHFGSRQFIHGKPGIDKFERRHFHHYPTDETSNCGCPPWLNNQVMCDFSGLPDLNTEDAEVKKMMAGLMKKFYHRGVTMIRIDAARHVFPESLADMVGHIPWDYVTLEVYHNVKYSNPVTFDKLATLGTMYDFAYGMMLSENMLDYVDNNQWVGRDLDFKKFLKFGYALPDCSATVCSTPVPPHKAMLFVDNHDRQRDRYKVAQPSDMCEWNIMKHLDNCLINFKIGAQYHVLQAFLLAFPYGDSVRIMSSYAFWTYRQGPPGVRPDSLLDPVHRVWDMSIGQTRCRSKPRQSPVHPDWDNDDSKPWICEHRWEGVGGAVRFRKLMMEDRTTYPMQYEWWDDEGRIAYSLGDAGFVALSRGHNTHSAKGTNETKDLSNIQTGLPEGTYCNLARLPGVVNEPSSWAPDHCTCDTVDVNAAGIITRGWLPGAEVVILHREYLTGYVKAPVEPDPLPPLEQVGTFWGWRNVDLNRDDPSQIGCCYAVALEETGEAKGLETRTTTAEACNETSTAGYFPSEEKIKFGFAYRGQNCPTSPEDALRLIQWSVRAENDTDTSHDARLKRPVYWVGTWTLFVVIIIGQLVLCGFVLCCRGAGRAAGMFVPDSAGNHTPNSSFTPLVQDSMMEMTETVLPPRGSIPGRGQPTPI